MRYLNFALLLSFVLALGGCHSSGSTSGSSHSVDSGSPGGNPPYLSSFKAFPPSIAKGDSATLSVFVSGASSATIDQSIGPVTSNCITVHPTVTTTYTLTDSNAGGTITGKTTVTVDAPVIESSPENISVLEGNGTTLSVTALGASPLAYQWRKSGAVIAGATASSYTTPATSMADDGASFSAVVSNAAGNATSDAAVLKVIPVRTEQTYVVDTANATARDTNPGTESSPWKTIQKAADTVLPGDLVRVKPGIYNERIQVNQGGVEGHPVVFISDTRRGAFVQHGFSINADFVRIEAFEITHDQGGWLQNGIWLAGNHVDVVDNYIHDVPGAGIAPSWASPSWNHILLSENRIYKCSAGLSAGGRDWLLEGNDVERLVNADGDSDYSRFFGRDITFRGNHFHGSLESEIRASHVDGFQTFSNNGEFAQNVLFEGNIVEDFHQGSMVEGAGVGTLTYRNNLFITHDWGGAWGICVGSAPNAQIVALNNTFLVQYHGVGFRNPAGMPGASLLVRNNILGSESGYWTENVQVTGSNNLLFSAGGPFSATDFPNDVINLDPMFVDVSTNDYHLKAGGPAIDAGMDLPGEIDSDLDGQSRPVNGKWDIGAYEFRP